MVATTVWRPGLGFAGCPVTLLPQNVRGTGCPSRVIVAVLVSTPIPTSRQLMLMPDLRFSVSLPSRGWVVFMVGAVPSTA
jgi:hypothetical protein